MRRLFDVLIAAALVLVPALVLTGSTAGATASATVASHYVASGLAPGDPGTL